MYLKTMRLASIQNRRKRSGQTALEYAMMLAVLILPLAFAFQNLLEEDEQGSQVIEAIVEDSYGSGERMGVVGRPYP